MTNHLIESYTTENNRELVLCGLPQVGFTYKTKASNKKLLNAWQEALTKAQNEKKEFEAQITAESVDWIANWITILNAKMWIARAEIKRIEAL